ncbi:hypothetical protein ABZS76_32715 [Streptomyces sp. NPDC005562]|uniref:hypothetical protein n=1 Tax=Streptomyces sp. NPDC005562 TaxID=3154890 RepID=UPI0033AF2DF2
MTTERPAYAPGCPAKGNHEPLPNLRVAFPWIEQAPSMTRAVTAFTVDCTPCVEHHQGLAGQRPELIHQALWLWLGTVAFTRVSMELPPVATAADMMDGLFETLAASVPSMSQGPAIPTSKVLRAIPLSEVRTPEGDQANTWQHTDVQQAVDALNPEHRELAWADLITLLSGWYQGAARAHAEAEGRQA